MKAASMEPNRPDLRALEEDFQAERRVFSVLYGRSYPEQLEWALGALPAAAVQNHMQAWSRRRELSLRYLQWMASYLRRHAGEPFATLLPVDEGSGVTAP